MKTIKRLMAIAAIACVAAPVMAQDTEDDGLDYKPYPHMFVGIQGGAQTTFGAYDNSKLITPTASVSFGAFFTPVVGARLHVNGIWNKGGYRTYDDAGVKTDFGKYDYKYVTTDLDLMINMCTLFGKKDYYPVNAYLIGGIGLNYAWDNGDAQNLGLTYAYDHRLSHNARVGAMVDYQVHKNVSINLEVSANSLSDRYNSKVANKDDWQLTAQLGLAFKFGYKKKPVKEVEPEPEPEPEPVEIWETRIDTTWYDETVYEDVTRDREFKKEIFFGLKEDGVSKDQEQITACANFLKGVTDGEVTITAYADKGTGTAKQNMKYSKQRAEKTKQALLDQGVDASLIKSVEWKGDTVQPYEENDKNRVSIITGHGVYTEKEAHTEKKFRTEEVRYRVQ